MTISRISVKIGKRGKGEPHYNYVMGTGKYADKQGVMYTQSGNMPSWAQSNAKTFWTATDAHERANGQSYKEHILSLPRELTLEQQKTVVNAWIKQELGDKHPYTYAIHHARARDGGLNTHAHLMFSERQMDGIERDEQQFFKRANKKNPERGGAIKANTGLSYKEMKNNLMQQRERWGEHLREHLRAVGLDEIAKTVDMRNWKQRGLSEPPKNLSMKEIQMAKKMNDALSNHPYFIDIMKPPAPPAPTPTPKPSAPPPKPAPAVHHTPPPAPPTPPPAQPANKELDSKHSIQSKNPAPQPLPLPDRVTLPVFVHHATFDRYADITGVIIGHYNLHNDRLDEPKGLQTGAYRNITGVFDTKTGEMVASSLFNKEFNRFQWSDKKIMMLANRCEQEFLKFRDNPRGYVHDITQRHNVNFHIPEKFVNDDTRQFINNSVENNVIDRNSKRNNDNDFTM